MTATAQDLKGQDQRPRSSRLVLEFRAGDKMLVNGAALQFRTRASVVLSNRVRFLFGKQILAPEDACTPARRIYFAVQAAYVCEDHERPHFLEIARGLANEYAEATTSATARRLLADSIADLEAGNCWEAMRRIRDLFAHDDTVLAAPPAEC